jgi:hypothetical protein
MPQFATQPGGTVLPKGVTEMHFNDFLVDLDVADPGQVKTARTVNLGIKDGLQVFPPDAQLKSANRFFQFTGTALVNQSAHDDDNLHRGVVRVRLRFPVSSSVIYKGSATLAALANIHGEGSQEDLTFAADAALTATDPTDGGSVPNPIGLPANELYAIIDAAVQGDGSILTAIAYQANVLILDTEPDLVSILVRPTGTQVPYGPVATFSQFVINAWDFQLNLSGPVPPDRAPFNVSMVSSDQINVPENEVVGIDALLSSKEFLNHSISDFVPVETVTVTATAAVGKMTQKTANLVIQEGNK